MALAKCRSTALSHGNAREVMSSHHLHDVWFTDFSYWTQLLCRSLVVERSVVSCCFFFIFLSNIVQVSSSLKKKLDGKSLPWLTFQPPPPPPRSAYCYGACKVSSDHLFAVFLFSEIEGRSICTTERLRKNNSTRIVADRRPNESTKKTAGKAFRGLKEDYFRKLVLYWFWTVNTNKWNQ